MIFPQGLNVVHKGLKIQVTIHEIMGAIIKIHAARIAQSV
jgi:hypothetical protein